VRGEERNDSNHHCSSQANEDERSKEESLVIDGDRVKGESYGDGTKDCPTPLLREGEELEEAHGGGYPDDVKDAGNTLVSCWFVIGLGGDGVDLGVFMVFSFGP